MHEFRVIAQNLEMHEPVRFGQEYTYHSHHPMKQMLSPRYFLSEWTRLKRGDQIKIIRTAREGRDEDMEEYAEVLVLSPSREGVPLLALKEPINLPEAIKSQIQPEPTGREVYSDGSWFAVDKGPVHKWWVVDAEGNAMVKGCNEQEARAYARGDIPLPDQAA